MAVPYQQLTFQILKFNMADGNNLLKIEKWSHLGNGLTNRQKFGKMKYNDPLNHIRT